MPEEIRSTSATGGQKGVKPQRHSLLPKPGLDAIAEVYAFGADKYADHNWRRGYEWSKSYDALQRHLLAFWDGETNDEESGLPHLGHAGFHVLSLLTWLAEQGEGAQNEYDDRWPAGLERASLEAEETLGDLGSRSISFAVSDIPLGTLRFAVGLPVTDPLEARFAVGPHGTEDRDDSAGQDFGPDLLSKRPPRAACAAAEGREASRAAELRGAE